MLVFGYLNTSIELITAYSLCHTWRLLQYLYCRSSTQVISLNKEEWLLFMSVVTFIQSPWLV